LGVGENETCLSAGTGGDRTPLIATCCGGPDLVSLGIGDGPESGCELGTNTGEWWAVLAAALGADERRFSLILKLAISGWPVAGDWLLLWLIESGVKALPFVATHVGAAEVLARVASPGRTERVPTLSWARVYGVCCCAVPIGEEMCACMRVCVSVSASTSSSVSIALAVRELDEL
jgi:hypothetical protein